MLMFDNFYYTYTEEDNGNGIPLTRMSLNIVNSELISKISTEYFAIWSSRQHKIRNQTIYPDIFKDLIPFVEEVDE